MPVIAGTFFTFRFRSKLQSTKYPSCVPPILHCTVHPGGASAVEKDGDGGLGVIAAFAIHTIAAFGSASAEPVRLIESSCAAGN